jgi:ABC-type bacteriocin/lantibiotic exporter with double-glycine peptidase domain
VTRNALLVDAGIALVLAILVIVISPGLAVVGLLALLVLLICAISFLVDRRRRRRRANPVAELRRSRRTETRDRPVPRAGTRRARTAPSRRDPRRR